MDLDSILAKKNLEKVEYLNSIEKISFLDSSERKEMRGVADKYPFRANDYYLGLIDEKDPDDPIRKIILPNNEELNEWGDLDPSNESSVTVVKGVQHKYSHTVLLLCHEICGGNCRYCFRKRIFQPDNTETNLNVDEGLDYIRRNFQVTNVLLTGGDPLVLSTPRLEYIINELDRIPHVKVIRIGSKMTAFNPFRIIDDIQLQNLLKKINSGDKQIYMMTHFDHPNELTKQAVKALKILRDCGVILCNQCPLLAGINDNPKTLAKLYNKLVASGCTPYYLFQGRPTKGNEPFKVPISRGYEIFEEVKKLASGTAIRAKFVMSHESGKIEIIGVDEKFIYMKYHRAKDKSKIGKVMIFERDEEAYWLNSLKQVN
ncbi:MAG: KamA family radical SAM protein [Spirochaetales bacterium]|nr:KamA family radical SAM protein [Spirochaetales bacterium]